MSNRIEESCKECSVQNVKNLFSEILYLLQHVNQVHASLDSIEKQAILVVDNCALKARRSCIGTWSALQQLRGGKFHTFLVVKAANSKSHSKLHKERFKKFHDWLWCVPLFKWYRIIILTYIQKITEITDLGVFLEIFFVGLEYDHQHSKMSFFDVMNNVKPYRRKP